MAISTKTSKKVENSSSSPLGRKTARKTLNMGSLWENPKVAILSKVHLLKWS